MKKNGPRGFVLFPQDYFGDVQVRLMPGHLRIFWVEAFFLMSESPRRGVLLKKNGKPYSIEDLATAMNLSLEIVREASQYVLDQEIASLDKKTGSLINRKMVRDAQKKSEQVRHGSQGGNPALTKNYNAPGFIYLIRRNDGAIKIGIAINVQNRFYKLRQKFPDDGLTLLAFTPVENMGKTEGELHETFNEYRVLKGTKDEWFKLPKYQLDRLFSTLPFSLKGEMQPDLTLKGPRARVPDPEPDPVLPRPVHSSLNIDYPPTEKRGGRPRDAASDLFIAKCLERTGSAYLPEKADFVMLAKLRRAFQVEAMARPPGWEEAVEHYFASPLGQYSLADLANPKRYAVFKNSALDEFNKPVNRRNGNARQESKGERLVREQHEAGERARDVLRGTTGNGAGAGDSDRTDTALRRRLVGPD